MSTVLAPADQSVMSAALVESVIAWLQQAALKPAVGSVDHAERIDRITQLERLRAVAAAVQAHETAAFARCQAAGVSVSRYQQEHLRRSIAGQVALARREHPRSGAIPVGVATVLTSEMPHSYAALGAGQISEWQATIMVTETATLTLEHRQMVDSMTYLTALLPMAHGAIRARGHQPAADSPTDTSRTDATSGTEGLAGLPAGVGLDLPLIITDRTLFDGDHEPAVLTGYGPIPAPIARHLIRGISEQVKVFIRRLFTDPITGNLTAMDTHRRLFPPAAQGGPTRINNGQGLCQSCNLTKEAAGWTSTPNPDGSIIITTPTRHHYRNNTTETTTIAAWSRPLIPADISRMVDTRKPTLLEFRLVTFLAA